MSTDEPRYLIYSLTKTFIAVLFCRLADRGELSLDSPVTAWLDEPRLQEPTLRELLNHTAGVPDYADSGYAEAVRSMPLEPWPDEKLLLHALRRDPPPPWMYSNTGYLLLRRVLDTLVPGGFASALERELTVPLGMTETTLALDPGDLDELAPGLSSQIGAATQDVRAATTRAGWAIVPRSPQPPTCDVSGRRSRPASCSAAPSTTSCRRSRSASRRTASSGRATAWV